MRGCKVGGALVAVAVLTAACGGDGGQSTKGGGSGAPVTLRIGTDDMRGRPAADQIEEVARQVEDRSDGRLRIEPVWRAAGEAADDWDQVVARKVADGRLDMGMIPARAWDTEGVTTLQALHAPFLVTSDELVGEIVSGDLADEMLAGLDETGVTGLALLPEDMRYLFAFGEPVRSLADIEGATIRVPRSDTAYAIFEALGAKPDDLGGPGDLFPKGVVSGDVRAADSSYALAPTLPGPTTATGNVTLYPKVNSLVVNADVFDDLSDEQQETLRAAAAATRDWAVERAPSEAEALRAEFCRVEGGRVVLASDADVAAFEQATQPVYDDLERDEATAALIERIRDIKEELPPAAPVTPCEPSGGELAPPVEGDESAAPDYPEGVYRAEITEDDLRNYFPEITDRDLESNHGTFTCTIADGRFSCDQRPPGYIDTYEGRYEVAGDRITFYLAWLNDLPATFTWRFDGDSIDLDTVGDIPPVLAATFTAHPWAKIG